MDNRLDDILNKLNKNNDSSIVLKEIILELVGIKKHSNGNWVHPLIGVVDGIDECNTETDIICKLLESYMRN